MIAGRLVGEAEDLDRRHEPLAVLAAGVDLDEGLAEFIVRELGPLPTAQGGEVPSRKDRLECFPEIGDEAAVEVREDLRAFQVGVHAGKGRGHRNPRDEPGRRSRRWTQASLESGTADGLAPVVLSYQCPEFGAAGKTFLLLDFHPIHPRPSSTGPGAASDEGGGSRGNVYFGMYVMPRELVRLTFPWAFAAIMFPCTTEPVQPPRGIEAVALVADDPVARPGELPPTVSLGPGERHAVARVAADRVALDLRARHDAGDVEAVPAVCR